MHRPRKLWVRRALFQVHLWAGIAFSLYLVVIAMTGSILVFEDDIARALLPAGLSRYDAGHVASIDTVLRELKKARPDSTAGEVSWPSPVMPAFLIAATDATGQDVAMLADPVTGRVQAHPRNWLNWVHDLHVELLLGQERHGVQWNGVGAVALMVLVLSGPVLWWQGIKNWARGLVLSLRSNWRRLNYDLHHAVGIWTLAFMFWWALSGIFFAWYGPFERVFTSVFPVQTMRFDATLPPPPAKGPTLPLGVLMADAQKASPGGVLHSVSDVMVAGPTLYFRFQTGEPQDFAHRDLMTLDTHTGRVLKLQHYGRNKTFGDWGLWAMHPLHFGNVWGLTAKIIWAAAGLALALLSVSGLLMYWNRYLRHRLG